MNEKIFSQVNERLELSRRSVIRPQFLWKVGERTEPDPIKQLFQNRGIKDAEKFFNPDFSRDNHDPFLLPNMARGVERIIEALEKGDKIAIFGDYDADGIPGSALLSRVLRANNHDPIVYIPNRDTEGYGLNKQAIEWLKQQGVGLIITVDLGITNREQVSFATKECGIDVIITDHHLIDQERIPNDALAIIHPGFDDSRYPFQHLAGGGVAWKLAQALSQKTGKPSENELKWMIELPAISTVCDIVNLTDENRMIVKFGLQVLRKTRNPGLRALYDAAGIDPTAINESIVGWQIGPRLNAPGRMQDTNIALKLLTTDDPDEARDLAQQVNQFNQERQKQLAAITREAEQMVLKDNLQQEVAIVLLGKDWSSGLMGLAASRLVEKFCRPVILMSQQGQVLKGSGRSIDGFNLVEAIGSQKHLVKEFGGHIKAAGLSMDPKCFEDFYRGILEYAKAKLDIEQLKRVMQAETTIQPEEVTFALAKRLDQFAPFGPGNQRPRFVVQDLKVKKVSSFGENADHLKFEFDNCAAEAIGWRMGHRCGEVIEGDIIDVLGRLEISAWHSRRMGRTFERLRISIEDLRSGEVDVLV